MADDNRNGNDNDDDDVAAYDPNDVLELSHGLMKQGITDDNLRGVASLVVDINSNMSELSNWIGLFVNLKLMYLYNCSIIPPEITNCQHLRSLSLQGCENSVKEFSNWPVVDNGGVFQHLHTVTHVGKYRTAWSNDDVATMCSFFKCYVPNLENLQFYSVPRDTANLFMEGMLS
jgi:Leucine-rich repeat (LRR) protein